MYWSLVQLNIKIDYSESLCTHMKREKKLLWTPADHDGVTKHSFIEVDLKSWVHK